jgi:hypothetical protein
MVSLFVISYIYTEYGGIVEKGKKQKTRFQYSGANQPLVFYPDYNDPVDYVGNYALQS